MSDFSILTNRQHSVCVWLNLDKQLTIYGTISRYNFPLLLRFTTKITTVVHTDFSIKGLPYYTRWLNVVRSSSHMEAFGLDIVFVIWTMKYFYSCYVTTFFHNYHIQLFQWLWPLCTSNGLQKKIRLDDIWWLWWPFGKTPPRVIYLPKSI